MKCPKCGAEVASGSRFCTTCGQSMAAVSQPAAPAAPQPVRQYAQPQQQYAQPQYNIYNNMSVTEANLPAQYKPLSPWAYFGLSLLFAAPIVGFVFLIVFSFNNNNINRRNYARSFFCMLLIAAILLVIFVLVVVLVFSVSFDSIFNGGFDLRYLFY